MKSKEKNKFLKTNYKPKKTDTKFNSIGKIISMNYPFIQNNSEKKPKYNDKNLIKVENLFSNLKKEPPLLNKINIDSSKANNSKSQKLFNKNTAFVLSLTSPI